MRNVIYLAVPAYEGSGRLNRTLAVLREKSVCLGAVDVEVAKRSVVQNKNALLKRARLSRANWVCFADDDVEPNEMQWDGLILERITLAEKRTGAKVGQASPRILRPDGTVFCAWINIRFDPITGDHCVFNPCSRMRDEPWLREDIFAPALPGTLTLFSRDFLDAVGWQFDDRYPRSQQEDVDQSLTCRACGFSLLFSGGISATHFASGRTPRAARENLQLLYEKWGVRADLTFGIPAEPAAVKALALADDASGRMTVARAAIRAALRPGMVGRVLRAARLFRMAGVGGVIAYWRDRALKSIAPSAAERGRR